MFERVGWSVAIDRPFGGALVPMRYYQRDARVQGLMIEVNRGLYLEKESGERGERFGEVAAVVQEVMRALVGGFGAV